MDNCHFSAAVSRCLETCLRNVTLLDAMGLVNRRRIVKSETESAFMKNAARVVKVIERGLRDHLFIGVSSLG